MDPAPIDSIVEGDQTICVGDSATFTATEGDFYYWNTGDTSQSITVSDSGDYIVTVFYDFACKPVS